MSWLSSICLFVRHRCIVSKWCKIGSRLLLITNRKWIRPVRLDGNYWPWMTLKVVTCIFNGKLAIYWKWSEIRFRLLLITNRKWHTPFQMTKIIDLGWPSSSVTTCTVGPTLAAAGLLVAIAVLLLLRWFAKLGQQLSYWLINGVACWHRGYTVLKLTNYWKVLHHLVLYD